jgi:CMP-N,N'-diacetyllegionaminic acid synthase
MKTLFLITARGGSKGIPGKNIKELGGKPLIAYSIDIARKFVGDEFICVSTDSEEIIRVVEEYGLKVPFKRPDELATDIAGSYEVILHALDWYKNNGIEFENIVLLQPTSPFRLKAHIAEALSLYNTGIDMVTSVQKVKSNIYSTYYIQNENSFIEKVFIAEDKGIRRQDSETIYELNGSIYVINVESIKTTKLGDFKRIKKIVMDDIYSVDIDEPIDWKWCEFILHEKLVNV